MKASILAAFLLLGALPAAAQTNDPLALTPGGQNQIFRQLQIEGLLRQRQANDVLQQQAAAELQQQIDSLNDSGNVNRADISRLQRELERLQDEQQLQALRAVQRIVQIDRQGDTARRRRWAAQFAREQQLERLDRDQRLAGIKEELARFSGR